MSRLAEAVEQGLTKGKGNLLVLTKDEKEFRYSSNLACPECGFSIEELQPRLFSFNPAEEMKIT